jgi:hypothetical protein
VKLPPQSEREGFYNELITKCGVSRNDRRSQYMRRRAYYQFGVPEGQEPAVFNKVEAAIDTLSAFLFAADTARFSIKLGAGADKQGLLPMIPPMVERLNDRWHDSNGDYIFGNAVIWSLVYDSMLVKLIQKGKETVPFLVEPANFGVLREDITMLDRQEAFCHWYMTTKDLLHRQLAGHPSRDIILTRVHAAPREDSGNEMPAGVQRIIASAVSPNIMGNVQSPLSGTSDWYKPKSAEELVEMCELYVWNDDAREGAGGWQIVTMANEGAGVVIYDREMSESMFIAGEHPFTQVCPNPLPDYFWGKAEVEKICGLQDKREYRMAQIDNMLDRAINPPKSVQGQWGAVEEKNFAMMRINALISSSDPMAKIQEHKPQIPPDAWNDIREIDSMFDEVMGLSNVLKGKGEAGVRSKGQTDRLAQLGSSRTKKRALIVEDSLERLATLYMKLDQRHNADPLHTEKGDKFIANQFTDNAVVKVDAHSSSPVFVEDHKNGAYAMFDRQIIDGEAVLDAEQPQNIQVLKVRYREMQKQKAAAEAQKAQQEGGAQGSGQVIPMGAKK